MTINNAEAAALVERFENAVDFHDIGSIGSWACEARDLLARLSAPVPAREWIPRAEGERIIEQFCKDLNQAHDELLMAQGCASTNTGNFDWPEWTPQANSIRWAEKLLGRKLAKTNLWTLFPPPPAADK